MTIGSMAMRGNRPEREDRRLKPKRRTPERSRYLAEIWFTATPLIGVSTENAPFLPMLNRDILVGSAGWQRDDWLLT